MKLRLVLGVALLLLSAICFTGWVENTWAASFRNPNSAEHMRRAEWLFGASVLSFVTSIVIFAWTRAKRLLPTNCDSQH